MTEQTRPAQPHVHEWERGVHMAEVFGVDGRRYACAICGELKPSYSPQISRRGKRKDGRLKGYGVFACRVCGQPIPNMEFALRGMGSFADAVRAGYCSALHLREGRRNDWPDDPALQSRLTR